MISDPTRVLHNAWGLGTSSFWHVLNPWSLGAVVKLRREEGIWNRETESGSRWQMGGVFAVDGGGVVRDVQVAEAADQIGDFAKAWKALG